VEEKITDELRRIKKELKKEIMDELRDEFAAQPPAPKKTKRDELAPSGSQGPMTMCEGCGRYIVTTRLGYHYTIAAKNRRKNVPDAPPCAWPLVALSSS